MRRPATLAVAASIAVMVLALAAGAWLWRRSPVVAIVRTADQNILLVTIDTLRADALGCYGGPAATPQLDRLAAEGVRFASVHAHAVMTLPSHASILTGLHPFEHGIRDNSGYRLTPETTTLAELLKARGFATAAFVGAFPLDSQFGLDQGFDVYDDRLGQSQGPSDFTIAERRADAVVRAAMEWMRARRSAPRPWFLWVHLFDPHAGYEPPPPFDRQYADSPYHGEVAYADQALGPLLDAVRAQSSRPTLVVVTSDHGEALGDHGETTHGLFAYESTLRVPLILAQLSPSESRIPNPESRPRVISTPTRHVDLLPTILDTLALPAPGGLPGRSLLAVLSTAAGESGAPVASYFEAMSASLNRGWAPLQGVILDREKFIELPLPELYDLAADPGERDNLIDRRPDRRRVAEARLRAFNAAPPGERVAERAEATRRLRALGYVSGSAPRKTRFTEEDDPKRLVELDQAIHEGVDLYQRGRPGEAIAVYRAILSRRPGMELVHRHLAFLYWSAGDVQTAIATLRAALRVGVTSESIRTQLGLYLAESGAPADAIPLLEAAAGSGLQDLDALNALGIAYARTGRHEQALRTFRRILDMDRDNAMALENIGAVHLQRGELAAAGEAFERALALAPLSARAHSGLGVVRLKSGDRAGALAGWRRAIELDPRDYEALYNLATVLADDGQLAAARPYAEQFVRTAPPALYGEDIHRLSALLAAR